MRLVTLLSLAALAACSNDNDTSGGDPDGGAPAALEAPPDGEGVQLRMSYTLAPGEVHDCQYFVLPEADLAVGRFEHAYTSGGHHIILYPTDLAPDEVEPSQLEVFDCDLMPNRGDVGFAYASAGTMNGEEYPAGVARRFAGQVVLLESHMLNTGDAPVDVDVRLNLWFAQGAVEQEVGTLFFYDNHILVPAGGTASAHMSCAVPADIHVSSLASHMHVRGTHFAARAHSQARSDTLIETSDWNLTEPTRFDPALTIAGGQTIDFDCDYRNPDGAPVIEGPSKLDNEMCLLIGTYWPRIDFPFEFCMGEGSGPVLDGDQTCGESFGCLAGAADPVAAESCAVDTCAGSSAAFNDFFACVALECFFPGRCDGSDCNACMFERCAPAVDACQSAGC
jgi:hypothetical protein